MPLTQQSAGWQDIPNSAPMLGNDQIGDAARYAESISTVAADTPGDLPSSGNWLGRTIWVISENCGYVWLGAVWQRTMRVFGAIGSGTSDGNGFVTVSHGMGVAPRSVTVSIVDTTPVIGNYLKANVDSNTFSATTFRIRVYRTDNGQSFASNPVTFAWVGLA